MQWRKLSARPQRRHGSALKVVLPLLLGVAAVCQRYGGGLKAWTTSPPHEAAPRSKVGESAPSRRDIALQAPLAGVGAASFFGSSGASAEEVAASAASLGGATLLGPAEYGAELKKFNDKPLVFVAGSTGELGRRVVLDLLKGGYSIRAGARDLSRTAEVQYDQIQAKKSGKYNLEIVMDALLEGGKQKELEAAIGDAAVVIDCAGARKGFDVLRPFLGTDETQPEKTDRNGTKALIDASIAKGVKKFIYISAVLTNAKAMKIDDQNEFKNWNAFGTKDGTMGVLESKHEAELYLESKKDKLDYTIIRPAPMTNDFPPSTVGGLTFLKPDSITLKINDQKLISRDDVSQVVVDSIFNAKSSRRTVELVATSNQKPTQKSDWWIAKDPIAAPK